MRKRKEKLKDLEGIDTSNIIVESRGRRAAAANFFAPKYTEVADMSDEDDQESSDSEGMLTLLNRLFSPLKGMPGIDHLIIAGGIHLSYLLQIDLIAGILDFHLLLFGTLFMYYLFVFEK